MKFVVCISRKNCGDLSTDDLTRGRLYELLAPADSHGMIRVIDDSGEDYLYPVELFETVEVPAEVTKTPIKLRLDPDIIDAFKASGRGWQTRMNDALRDWLKSHSAA